MLFEDLFLDLFIGIAKKWTHISFKCFFNQITSTNNYEAILYDGSYIYDNAAGPVMLNAQAIQKGGIGLRAQL